jgi:hypothetical protein
MLPTFPANIPGTTKKNCEISFIKPQLLSNIEIIYLLNQLNYWGY